jgi:hypothetical protein
MSGIDKHNSRYVTGIDARKISHHRTTERMPDQNERTFFTKRAQSVSQLEIDLVKGSWLWARFAPRVAGPVVSADASEMRDFVLNQDPVEREVAQAGLDNDGWSCMSCAVHMKFVAAKIHHFPWRIRDRRSGSQGCESNHDARANQLKSS